MIALRWLLALTLLACTSQPPVVGAVTVTTPPVRLTGLVGAYEGPKASLEFACSAQPPQPLWLKGISLRVLDAMGTEQPITQLLSGASLQLLDAQRNAELHGQASPAEALLFASDGRAVLTLPEGYGLPLLSNETLVLTAQWKNEEIYRRPLDLRLEATVAYSRHSLKPLRVTTAGLGWGWTSGAEVSTHEWPWPSPPKGEVVSAWPVVGADCAALDLKQGDDVVLQALRNPGGGRGLRLQGGDWRLLARSRQPDGIQRLGSAQLVVYLGPE